MAFCWSSYTSNSTLKLTDDTNKDKVKPTKVNNSKNEAAKVEKYKQTRKVSANYLTSLEMQKVNSFLHLNVKEEATAEKPRTSEVNTKKAEINKQAEVCQTNKGTATKHKQTEMKATKLDAEACQQVKGHTSKKDAAEAYNGNGMHGSKVLDFKEQLVVKNVVDEKVLKVIYSAFKTSINQLASIGKVQFLLRRIIKDHKSLFSSSSESDSNYDKLSSIVKENFWECLMVNFLKMGSKSITDEEKMEFQKLAQEISSEIQNADLLILFVSESIEPSQTQAKPLARNEISPPPYTSVKQDTALYHTFKKQVKDVQVSTDDLPSTDHTKVQVEQEQSNASNANPAATCELGNGTDQKIQPFLISDYPIKQKRDNCFAVIFGVIFIILIALGVCFGLWVYAT